MKTKKISFMVAMLLLLAACNTQEITPQDEGARRDVKPKPTPKIIKAFTPIPSRVVAGYWENWGTDSEWMYLRCVPTSYNVAIVGFITFANDDGYTAQFTPDPDRYANDQEFITDIRYLQAKGIPVLISVGGQNDFLNLDTMEKRTRFEINVEDIIARYGFDGLDVDLEGPSLHILEQSDIDNFPVPTSNRMKLTVEAFQSIFDHYQAGFILTLTPETFYLQKGFDSFKVEDQSGSFNVILENLKSRMSWLNPQLYNSGTMYGTDGVEYKEGTPNFIVAMTDMMLTGFTLNRTSSKHVAPVPQNKLTVGVPGCPGRGYMGPEALISALNYLRTGFTADPAITYNLNGRRYPDLKGVVIWSVNDEAQCNNETFSKELRKYFLP